MADFADPNYEPIPPDEPAARDFQISNRFPFEYHGWKKRGTAPVEYLDWQSNIPVESDGKVLLSRDSVMRLAIQNSRDYQFNYEQLYLAALALTQARFQFMVQGFSNSGWLGQIQGFGQDAERPAPVEHAQRLQPRAHDRGPDAREPGQQPGLQLHGEGGVRARLAQPADQLHAAAPAGGLGAGRHPDALAPGARRALRPAQLSPTSAARSTSASSPAPAISAC